MLYSRFFLVSFLFVLTFGWATAQTATEELQKLIKTYQQKSEYNYALRFDFFADQDVQPRETMTGRSVGKAGQGYYKLANLEIVTEKGLIVVINHDDHYVLLDKEDSETSTTRQDPETLLKGIAKSGQRLTLENGMGGRKTLQVYAEGSAKPSAAIMYSSLYNIEKIITYYGEEYSNYLTADESAASRLEVTITTLALTEPLLKFSSIVRSGSPYKLAPNYQKYQFFNRLDQ